jgi:hypothetical protein
VAAACILLLLLRIPILVEGFPVLVPELRWMLIGERIARGYMLYTQTWDSTSPLAALVYWIIDLLFGRSPLAYQVLSIVLVTFQAVYITASFQQQQLFSEKSALPAFLYVLCTSIFPDFFTLSPMLMATTFLLMAMDASFAHLGKDVESDSAFSVGFHLGVATLFYLPLGVFLPMVLLSFLFLSASRIRKFFLILFGFAFPLTFAFLFFYLINAYDAFYFNWINSLIQQGKKGFLDLPGFLLLFIPYIVLLIMAVIRLYGGDTRFINYQIRCQQFMFIWLLFAGLSLLFIHTVLPFQLMVFVPAVVFFGTHYFLLAKRKWVGEIIALLLLAFVVINTYGVVFSSLNNLVVVDYKHLFVDPNPENANYKNQKMLILGDEQNEYLNNTPVTPYLNWELAERHFDDLDNFVSVTSLYENFRQDPPDVLIDKRNKVVGLFNRIPALAEEYQRQGNTNVYIRKKTLAAGNKQ